MGGGSTEHEVSLSSGAEVLKALDPERYEGIPVRIEHDGAWSVNDAPPVSLREAIQHLHALGIDCVFNALHGGFGEDGRIQGLLDLLGWPYTGSGHAASALAMDKVRCKAVASSQGIRVANHIALDRATWKADPEAVLDTVSRELGFPCIVKTGHGGSSVGVCAPADVQQLEKAMEETLQYDGSVLIEKYIAGREVTCGVLDVDPLGRLRALPVTEIIPRNKGAFWTYEDKYAEGATEEITPAELPPELTNQVMDMAVHVHEIVGCRGWSRSDFIIGAQGPVWLEVNTVPGLTPTSLYPQACAAAGISYRQMVTLFIEKALRDAAKEQ
jgi:D-alanine-D-alanine ligase